MKKFLLDQIFLANHNFLNVDKIFKKTNHFLFLHESKLVGRIFISPCHSLMIHACQLQNILCERILISFADTFLFEQQLLNHHILPPHLLILQVSPHFLEVLKFSRFLSYPNIESLRNTNHHVIRQPWRKIIFTTSQMGGLLRPLPCGSILNNMNLFRGEFDIS